MANLSCSKDGQDLGLAEIEVKPNLPASWRLEGSLEPMPAGCWFLALPGCQFFARCIVIKKAGFQGARHLFQGCSYAHNNSSPSAAIRSLGGANLAAQRLAFTEQKMSTHRVYKSHEFMQPAEKEPIRSVVVESSHSVIVAWHVEPGQTIAPHIHPDGQDTWTILSGEGQYQIDEQGNTVAIVPGDIVVANKGQVHGVLCTSVGPLRFISVVAPLDAGYEPLSAKT
ncbi:MAG: cupin domain-containing protein [Ramlibacter sp.]